MLFATLRSPLTLADERANDAFGDATRMPIIHASTPLLSPRFSLRCRCHAVSLPPPCYYHTSMACCAAAPYAYAADDIIMALLIPMFFAIYALMMLLLSLPLCYYRRYRHFSSRRHYFTRRHTPRFMLFDMPRYAGAMCALFLMRDDAAAAPLCYLSIFTPLNVCGATLFSPRYGAMICRDIATPCYIIAFDMRYAHA